MSTTSARFNQRESEAYGYCQECDGLTFSTQAEAAAHMDATSPKGVPGRSHSIRILAPSRESLIRSAVRSIIDGAISDAVDDLINLTESRRGEAPDATESEITEALKWYGDEFSEAWAEYLESEADE